MNVYNFKKIEKCYVFGNIDRNMDRFINSITSNISKFTKEEHPKEIERQERLKKRNEKTFEVGLDGFAMPHPTRNLRQARRRDLGNELFETFLSKSPYGNSKKLDSSFDNSVIIVSGNCGIGTKSKKYYEETFTKLEKSLSDNNCFILFVRGNNDNPSIFNDKEIDYEHIKTIPDYSVVSLKTFNCLCIGGSVSMDKEWKLAQEELYSKKLYWENEAPQYKEDELNDILSKYKINCVITSTCPSFAYPGTNAFKKSKWFSNNKNTASNFSNERKVMDKIYERLMDEESKPYIWFYGRFKMSHTDKINDMVFASLQSYGMMQVNSQLEAFFGIDTSKTLENNGHTFDNIICEETAPRKQRDYIDMDRPIAVDEGIADEPRIEIAEVPNHTYFQLNEAQMEHIRQNFNANIGDLTYTINTTTNG